MTRGRPSCGDRPACAYTQTGAGGYDAGDGCEALSKGAEEQGCEVEGAGVRNVLGVEVNARYADITRPRLAAVQPMLF